MKNEHREETKQKIPKQLGESKAQPYQTNGQALLYSIFGTDICLYRKQQTTRHMHDKTKHIETKSKQKNTKNYNSTTIQWYDIQVLSNVK